MADGFDDRIERELLIAALPPRVATALTAQGDDAPDGDGLLEVVLDLGRPPTARYSDRELALDEGEVTEQDIDHVVASVSEFGDDNRAGIPRTLHRISAIRNRRGRIVGLTCRVGRAVTGSAGAILDLVESGRSVLLLGAPGVGKTTMLREAARVLADELGRRVVIVDTSNEIGGDGDIPHRGIGSARRMQVPKPELQHQVMIEAVENHMPEVIVIDEIGASLEASAARTIAERGVQLIGTAHGNTLHNLMQNPTLSDLIGGIESVTLGDEEARRRSSTVFCVPRRRPSTRWSRSSRSCAWRCTRTSARRWTSCCAASTPMLRCARWAQSARWRRWSASASRRRRTNRWRASATRRARSRAC